MRTVGSVLGASGCSLPACGPGRALMLGALLVVGCGDEPQGGTDPDTTTGTPTPPTPSWTDTAPPTSPATGVVGFQDVLEAAGWTVQAGELWFSTYDRCCDDGAACLGNNPSTPYGTIALPPAPGASPDPDLLWAWGDMPFEGLSRTWRMRPDEVFVWIGALPPEAAYFSYRSYSMFRFEEGWPDPIMGSLGRSLNQLVVAEERGVGVPAIWGAPFVVVSSADAASERAVIDALVVAGFDRATVHVDHLPPSVAVLGLEDTDDAIAAVVRIAIDADPAAGEAWRDDPGATVLRLTPPAEAPAEPVAVDELPSRGSGTDEAHLADALLALEGAILASYPDRATVVVETTPGFQETITCMETLTTCAGDIRDRLALVAPFFTLDDDEEVVVFGVNHARAGKAVYSSFAVVTEVHQIGVGALESPDMPGTARYWLPDHPQADELYAMVVARDCAGRAAPCLAVGTGCPSPEADERMRVTARAYLEEATGAAPHESELLPDRAIKVSAPSP